MEKTLTEQKTKASTLGEMLDYLSHEGWPIQYRDKNGIYHAGGIDGVEKIEHNPIRFKVKLFPYLKSNNRMPDGLIRAFVSNYDPFSEKRKQTSIEQSAFLEEMGIQVVTDMTIVIDSTEEGSLEFYMTEI
jgi:hypothetical protein